MDMRIEYTIRTTDTKGKQSFNIYASKQHADECYRTCKDFYEPKGYKVEYFKTYWNGSSFYKAEAMEA